MAVMLSILFFWNKSIVNNPSYNMVTYENKQKYKDLYYFALIFCIRIWDIYAKTCNLSQNRVNTGQMIFSAIITFSTSFLGYKLIGMYQNKFYKKIWKTIQGMLTSCHILHFSIKFYFMVHFFSNFYCVF